MCTCSYDYRYSSRSAGCYTTHTAGGSNHRLGVHLLYTEKAKCKDQFKVKMCVLMMKKIQNFEYYANRTKNDPLIEYDHR